MTEKDIKIEDEETLNEDNAQETDNTAEVEETEETGNTEEAGDAEKADIDPLEAAKAEIESLKTQMLYKNAEFDNYRKRTLKERAELILNGGEKTITALLPVIDDMERAIANGEKTDDPQVLREGMQLIYQKLMKALEAQGVSKIETDNADFDTNLHEAVALVPGMGDDKKGKVIDCMAPGYKLNDKVIRYAKVAVGQ
jgi:molecular chaperone GrpE